MSTSVVPATMEKQDPRYVLLQKETGWISTAIWSLVWLAVGVAAVAWFSVPRGLRIPLAVLWVLATVAHAWWGQYQPGLSYRYASFHLDDDGIEIRRGVFWRRIIDVPRSRVQHTDVSQGPFERRHGLGTLIIHTAGVSHAQVALPGLEHARALAIRDFLLPRAHVAGA